MMILRVTEIHRMTQHQLIVKLVSSKLIYYARRKNFGGAYSRRLVRPSVCPSAFLVRDITLKQQEIST
jgi:hypothetical protein